MMKNNKNAKFDTKYAADYLKSCGTLLIFVSSLCIVIFFSPMISEEMKKGLLLCYTAIIPSIFPFSILADLMLSYMHFELILPLRRAFSRLFKINGYAISAFAIGLLCGFPLGVKISRDLYISGKISKNECERLIGFSNNASPAFVISGVGYALFGSIRIGVFLYILSFTSSILSGILFSVNEKPGTEAKIQSQIEFSLADSIKNAAFSSLTICGFISIFSVFIGFLRTLSMPCYALPFLASLLEVGNAAKIISESATLPYALKLSLAAFAISFSGFSVHLQAKSLLDGTNISMTKYYLMKLFTAVLSFSLALLIFLIYK